jgi:hypothetical protein
MGSARGLRRGPPNSSKPLNLKGLLGARGFAKTAFSGYNISYFNEGVRTLFESTGKPLIYSIHFAPPKALSAGRFFESDATEGAGARKIRARELYLKGLFDGNHYGT